MTDHDIIITLHKKLYSNGYLGQKYGPLHVSEKKNSLMRCGDVIHNNLLYRILSLFQGECQSEGRD